MSRKWFKGIKSIIVQRGEDYYLSGIVKISDKMETSILLVCSVQKILDVRNFYVC